MTTRMIHTSAALAAACLLSAGSGATAAQTAESRWVYGPGESTQCAGVPGFPTLHAALEGLDPTRHTIIHISRAYRHQVPAGPDPRVRISALHAAAGGTVALSGGKTCSGAGIGDAFPGARSQLVSVNGGRILLVDRASRVTLEGLEFRGARAAPGAVHPALHILGSNPESTHVTLRRVIVSDNIAGNNGVVIVGRARVEIEGALFIGNQGNFGAALLLHDGAEVSIAGLPSSPEFATTRFENNRASGSGGAILAQFGSETNLGAKLWLQGGTSAQTPGILFSGNQASDKGGAIDLGRLSELEVSGHVRFEGNAAADGGAISIHLDAASATSPRVRIRPAGSTARPVFSANQALVNGGAIHCRPNDDTARNRAAIGLGPARFQQNEAVQRGGAVYVDGCRIDSLAGPGELEFSGNRVSIGRADPAAEPQPRGGGALFASRASVTLGTGGAFVTAFEQNRVERVNGYWGRPCATQFCVLRGLSGGAVMLVDGAGFFYDTRFVENLAPFGGAISALDSNLTVDQASSGCSQTAGCSQFRGNRASGAAYLDSDASAGRARRGYGAAIAVRNDRADPATGLHRTVRIERSRFTDHGSGCPAGMSCAQDPERLLRGRVIQANVPDPGQLIVRGNLFAHNAQPDDVPTSTAQADDAEVSLYRRPPGSGAARPVLLSLNTFWKEAHCPGAPHLVDVRDSTGQAGRIDVAANLLLGCFGDRNFTAPAQTSFGVYACNIASTPEPAQATIRGHNRQEPSAREFFVDASGGDFRLRDNVYGAVATDVCGNQIAGQSIVTLLQSLGTDLGGQPRPVRFGGGITPEAGDWDVGAYERQPPAAQPLIFANGFE